MRAFRLLLLPFSWLYGLVLNIRHFLYDKGFFKVYSPKQKTIVVGNLSLGGTGKTPMVNYLIETIGEEHVAVLSRGYGRKTTGTLEVLASMTPAESGDEPLLLKKNHPRTVVVVDENRARGLEFLLKNHPSTDKVILDDAMQHRQIKPAFTFLLTTWRNPFYKDHLLPAGNLRDVKSRKKAADAIVVTKCPPEFSEKERSKANSLSASTVKPTFFSSIRYAGLLDAENNEYQLSKKSKAVVLTGIANTEEFIEQVDKQFEVIKHFKYADHHEFSLPELHSLREFIDTFAPAKPPIITTEKDWQRLKKHNDLFANQEIQILHWKIEVDFGEYRKHVEELIHSI